MTQVTPQKQACSRVLVVVMDGIGIRANRFGNAVALAETPTLHSIEKLPLFTTLKAHGTYVGLPSDSDIGNSEVGHNALGAGRIFAQGATLVNQAIESKRLFAGKTWQDLVKSCKKSEGTLHFIGLLSDGNVHSHENHLYAMLAQAKREGLRKIRIHTLLDGRDVGEKSAEIYLSRLEEVIKKLDDPDFDIQVASGGGRMVLTMDRYNADPAMVDRGWQVHVLGQAQYHFSSISGVLPHFRADPKLSDQYIPGFVIVDALMNPVGPIEDGDGVVLFNFRGDRAIEISRAFTEVEFKDFDRKRFPKVFFAGMMEYDGDLHIPPRYLVEPPAIDNTLSEYLIGLKVRQFACSETQKYGHVTFFWNGNRSGYFNKDFEEYVEIPSDKICFDEKPRMKAKEIADVAIDRMQRGSFDFGRINFPNGDMVGHTGNLQATIEAVEEVDRQLQRLLDAALATKTTLIITADHGNADEMFDGKEIDFPEWQKPRGQKPPPKTSHTLAPVPFAIYGYGSELFDLSSVPTPSLGNVAATVVELLGLRANPLYLPSLVVRKPLKEQK